jgi:hypothetical protein
MNRKLRHAPMGLTGLVLLLCAVYGSLRYVNPNNTSLATLQANSPVSRQTASNSTVVETQLLPLTLTADRIEENRRR